MATVESLATNDAPHGYCGKFSYQYPICSPWARKAENEGNDGCRKAKRVTYLDVNITGF